MSGAWRALLRLLAVQGTWNYERMLGVGMGYAAEPLLEDLGPLDLGGSGWVILGGESGPGARPLREEWAVAVRDACRSAGVPFFFKQWGGRTPKQLGRSLDGRTWDGMPAPKRRVVA